MQLGLHSAVLPRKIRPVGLLPDPLWSGHKGAVVVFAVGVSRLDKLFGSLDEPKDSANWLMGKVECFQLFRD